MYIYSNDGHREKEKQTYDSARERDRDRARQIDRNRWTDTERCKQRDTHRKRPAIFNADTNARIHTEKEIERERRR